MTVASSVKLPNDKRVEGKVPQPKRKPLEVVLASYVLIALIVAVAVDLTARFTYPLWPIDHYNSPNKSWIYWAMKDFRNQDKPADVVLMGSSLMMAALHGGDATWENKSENVTSHHRSRLFESLLKTEKDSEYSTFAFAIAGQMASDAYMITTANLKDANKPGTIVYGIAPRDLMDNTFTSLASSETFRYLSRVSDQSKLAIESRSAFWEQLEYWLGQVSFIYGHRADFNYLQMCATKALLTAVGHKDLENAHVPFDLRKIAMMDYPEDTAQNEILIEPYGKTNTPFYDNTAEYRSRFSRFNKKQFDTQFGYLSRMAKYCKDNGIELVLVNMPLTQQNLQLMPQGFYDHYLSAVKGLCSATNANFVDLNHDEDFPQKMFADCAHLNGLGGEHFFRILAKDLAEQHISVAKRQQ